MEYVKVAETSLPLRVAPESRVFYDDMVRRSLGRIITKEQVCKILRDGKIIEEYQYGSPITELHRLSPPEEFPCKVGLFDQSGHLRVKLVPNTTKIKDYEKMQHVPDGYKILWFHMILRGTTLQSLMVHRSFPITKDRFFPNVMNNTITVGYVVPVAEQYAILKDSQNSDHTRSSPGPPLWVVPYNIQDDLRTVMIENTKPYITGSSDYYFVRIVETYIPVDQRHDSNPILAEYTIRAVYTLDKDVNTVIFDESELKYLVPYAEKRAEYIQTWQRMERDAQRHGMIHHFHTMMDRRNERTRYSIDLDSDGRILMTYYLPDSDGSKTGFITPISTIEFRDASISPCAIYNTEIHCMERVGAFSNSEGVFSILRDVVPYHVHDITVPQRDPLWRDPSLYSYQKEGVEAMMAHELFRDGVLGLYMSRLSGKPGSPGIFKDYCNPNTTLYIDTGFEYQSGMLCDDVGMGKTRQIVALTRYTRGDASTATLVVVPPSILQQWENEIRAAWQDCKLVMWYGRRRVGIDLAQTAPLSDIVLTSYSTLNKWFQSFSTVNWYRVVYDESQSIPRTLPKLDAKKTWYVTATPSLCWKRVLNMIFRGMVTNNHIGLQARIMTTQITSLNETIWRYTRPLIIQRTRERYLDLPRVTRTDVAITLNEEERQAYDIATERIRERYNGPDLRGAWNNIESYRSIRQLQTIASSGRDVMGVTTNDQKDQWFHPEVSVPDEEIPGDDCCICISPLDQPVRTLCRHWYCKECIGNALVRNTKCPMCRAVIDPGTIFLTDTGMSHQQVQENTDMDVDHTMATKIAKVLGDIQTILDGDPTDRVLVFFDSRAVLEDYSAKCKARGILHTSIHGGVSVSTRSRRIAQFQYNDASPIRVLFLTVKTASAGITLTKANHILLVSTVTSPDLETQMIGRSNRLGQQKPVHFTRYIATDTIEEVMAIHGVRPNPTSFLMNVVWNRDHMVGILR